MEDAGSRFKFYSVTFFICPGLMITIYRFFCICDLISMLPFKRELIFSISLKDSIERYSYRKFNHQYNVHKKLVTVAQTRSSPNLGAFLHTSIPAHVLHNPLSRSRHLAGMYFHDHRSRRVSLSSRYRCWKFHSWRNI